MSATPLTDPPRGGAPSASDAVVDGARATASVPPASVPPAAVSTGAGDGARARSGRWRVQFAVEYAAARLAVGALSLLGWRTASAAGGALARLAWRAGLRRRIVERQLADAFPDLPAGARETIARDAYDSLGRTFVETATLPGNRDAILARMATVTGWDVLEAALAEGRGAMLVTGHLGNWEFGGAYTAARGIPIDVIAKHIANPRVDRWLAATRARIGMRVVFDDEAVRVTPRALREGRLIAFLCDQDARGLASTFVPFFGQPARTPRGPAVFALRLDVPVLFGACTRLADGRYRLDFERLTLPPRTGDRDADVDAIVAAYTARLERAVRDRPGQYFWHHRRWKRKPPR